MLTRALPALFTAAALCANGTLAGTASVATASDGNPPVGLPNPAAVYCSESGGQYEIRTLADGSKTGICTLPSGEERDAWAYFRERSDKP